MVEPATDFVTFARQAFFAALRSPLHRLFGEFMTSSENALPARFDPADAGVPESDWLEFMAGRTEWSPANGGLLVVSPHPDDELLGAGGLIREWALAGRHVSILSVTDGEAAYPHGDDLGAIRRHELAEALRKLCGVHVSVVRAGIADGQVARHINRLRNAILALAKPSDTLIAPYECDGHPDHEAAGRVCCELASSHHIPLARYPIWTWHHTNPNTLGGLRWGTYRLSAETRRAKARAIRCFSSQLNPSSVPPIIPGHVLQRFERQYEAFIL